MSGYPLLPSFVLGLALIAQTPQDPPRPVTPGSILLLATSTDLNERQQPVAALKHADPVVRAVAARVLLAYGDPRNADALVAALTAESDATAGAEQVRAILWNKGEDGLAAVESHAARLGDAARGVLAEWRKRREPAAVDLAKITTPPPRVMRIWAPGLLGSATEAAGCKVEEKPRYGFARVTFAPSGRPKAIAIDAAMLSARCQELFKALLTTTVAESDAPVGLEDAYWIMVPFSRAFLDCTAVPDLATAQKLKDEKITEPRKTKDVRPVYPLLAQQQGRQGMVVIESVISSRGCVKEGRVIKSVALDLDVAALLAVTQWRFTPTLVGGSPVPVIMTVSVNFHLR